MARPDDAQTNKAVRATREHPLQRGADRPLTINELRSFVQRRMAIWAHDVTFGKDGEPAVVNWHLYRFGDDGLVEYLGVEPGAEPSREAAE